MMMKSIIMGLSIFLYSGLLNAQTLKIGNELPEIELLDVINYKTDRLYLSDVKGKLIILDFWNHLCAACIKSFPKLDSLQKEFGDKIQIILVNRESKDSTQRFFKKRPALKKPELIMVTGDKKLAELFPVDGYPYCVWIDADGIIRNFSGSHMITHKTISDFLKGGTQSFADPTKRKTGSPLDPNLFRYFSYISPCNEKLYIGNSERVYSSDSSYVHIASNCASVKELFLKAYGEKGKYNFNTKYGLQLQVRDSMRYVKTSDVALLEDWSSSNGYNYELQLPSKFAEIVYRVMQEDLIRYFPLSVSIKEKQVQGVILVADDTTIIQSKRGKPINTFSSVIYGQQPNEYRQLVNQPFQILLAYLNLWIQNDYPFRSNVNIDGYVDIKIREHSVNPLNIQLLNEDLKKYGLRLVFLDMPVPVLHLKEKD